ncbi:hypothetical protein P3F83_18100 [Mycobacteroides immunogenum]|uniref:hypothetical protein n=1 Tax=Mycobacteroides immunogenum TaxID=83262 RepID=UPI0025B7A213|nr:hypothetical protein [Mycobacteroides immunogenum]WJR32423.1 hypothetical protein P3F83_18100 [Mycobacteroides immunogenum]
MKTIRLLVGKPEFSKGSVLDVDDVSAAALIDKEEAELYDPAEDAESAEPKARRGRRGRGTSQSVKVADPDMPSTEAPTEGDNADGEGGGENV